MYSLNIYTYDRSKVFSGWKFTKLGFTFQLSVTLTHMTEFFFYKHHNLNLPYILCKSMNNNMFCWSQEGYSYYMHVKSQVRIKVNFIQFAHNMYMYVQIEYVIFMYK